VQPLDDPVGTPLVLVAPWPLTFTTDGDPNLPKSGWCTRVARKTHVRRSTLTAGVSIEWQPEGMAAEEFRNRDLKGSRFTHVDLSESYLRDVLLRDVRISGAWIQDLVIDADVEGSLMVNDVDVLPYMHEVLNARHPGRETVFAVREGDADAFRAAWAVDEKVWAETVERARRMPEEKLHERVDGEWSFIQTLRHLVFATDSWIRRAIQGDPFPYDLLDLPFSEMDEIAGVPNDIDARPTLDDVLALRADRMASVSEVIAGLTDEQLAGSTSPVEPAGYPESESFPVRRCLMAVVIEEWEHHQFANRDLAVLEASAQRV
jgi:uncharacterized damage-inducible protein DinB